MNGRIRIDRQNITYVGLDGLDISVENLRKTKMLNNGKLNKHSYHQLIKEMSRRSDNDDFIIKR